MRALSLPLASLALVLGCASTGIHAPSEGEPMRVSLLQYSQRQRFELANAAHTDPVDLYSTSRQGSGMKIAPDAVLADVIEFLGDRGFGDYETVGPAPGWGRTPFTLVFEVETAGGTSHWGVSKASSPAELKAMGECFAHFFNEAYNRVDAYQKVDNDDGAKKFRPASPFE